MERHPRLTLKSYSEKHESTIDPQEKMKVKETAADIELQDDKVKEKGEKRKRSKEGNTANMLKEMRIVRRRQKEAEGDLIRNNRELEDMMVKEGKEMEEQTKNTYDKKIAALEYEKREKVGMMADALSKRRNSLTQQNQEVLDNLKNKHKTEETEMVTKFMTRLDEEEEKEEEEEEDEEKEEKENIGLSIPPPPECPICYEPMVPPARIYQCGDGHLICSACRPQLLVTHIFWGYI